MGGDGGSPTASTSSSDDDGDSEWKAAIDSIAAVGFGVPSSNGVAKSAAAGKSNHDDEQEQPPDEAKAQAPGLKLYQVKVRKMLDDFLEKHLEIVDTPCLNLSDTTETNGGIKLFKRAPLGITVGSTDQHHVKLTRPIILPGSEIDEKSKKFRRRLQSVVVDGNDILASAVESAQRSLARSDAREAAAKAAAEREEKRVRELKKIRGEKWLPSVARQIEEEKAWKRRR